jgi:hypothetical protein
MAVGGSPLSGSHGPTVDDVNGTVLRGNLIVDGDDIGEVMARLYDGDGIKGVLIALDASCGAKLTLDRWLPAWLTSHDGRPAVPVQVCRSSPEAIEFRGR